MEQKSEWEEIQSILAKWSAADWYVYLRPIEGAYYEAAGLWWSVQVECRQVMPVLVRDHGPDLLGLLRRVDLQLPERSAGYRAERPTYAGWLAPEPPVRPLKREEMAAAAEAMSEAASAFKEVMKDGLSCAPLHARLMARRR